jgi:tetratricopeptide (TPR) repeat protein
MTLEELNTPTCAELETDLSAFVDGEVENIDMDKLMSHIDDCAHCQSLIEQLRQMARLHRACFTEEDILETLDGSEIFRNITSELVDEKIRKVAELFYQIGKAYLLKGFAKKNHEARRHHDRNKRYVFRVRTRPMAIESAKQRTGSLFREMEDISRSSDLQNRRLKRAKSFFWTNRRKKTEYLEYGRRFIEESLAIDPDNAESRLYLGAYFYAGLKKYDEAKEQFRKVLGLDNVADTSRADALINLGWIYTLERNYNEAKACFREVVKSGVIDKFPRYYRSLVFLAITYARLGEYENSISSFSEIFEIFPRRTEKIRNEIWDLQSFRSMIDAQKGFKRDLQDKVPLLFAS